MSGRRRHGFTLLEVVLAVGLMSLLAGGVFTFVWNLLDRRGALLEHGRAARGAALLVDAIERDLSGAVVAGGGEAGIRGTGAGVRVLTRGVWIGGGSGDEKGAADLQGAEYRFDEQRGAVVGRRWAGGKGDGGEGDEEMICERVERLRLRYLRGAQWVEAFDSAEAGGLPGAVEVAIWFGGRGEMEGEAEEGVREAEGAAAERAMREPDRVRVIVVPDGPDAAWGVGG